MRSQTSGGAHTGSQTQTSVVHQAVPNLIAPCPQVIAKLGNVTTNFLLDTGSMVSTIFEGFFRLNFEMATKSCNWLELTAANGYDIPYIGYVELDITVFGIVVPQRGILVVKDPIRQHAPNTQKFIS